MHFFHHLFCSYLHDLCILRVLTLQVCWFLYYRFHHHHYFILQKREKNNMQRRTNGTNGKSSLRDVSPESWVSCESSEREPKDYFVIQAISTLWLYTIHTHSQHNTSQWYNEHLVCRREAVLALNLLPYNMQPQSSHFLLVCSSKT